jgi:4-hydroxyphenylacetate 3-monooxygenase
VDNVTTHPAFRSAAHTVAAIYDMKADSANREIMSFTDGGEQCSMYYLRARTQEDLRRRMRAHRMIADIPNRLRKKNADGWSFRARASPANPESMNTD